MNIEALVRKNIMALKPYSSARDEFSGEGKIQLDANENPFGNGLNRYPDPYQRKLKQGLAKIKGVSSEQIVLGNGSDELIDLLFRAFCDPGIDSAIGLRPSYGMYQVCAAINNVDYQLVDLNEEFSLSADKILETVNNNTKLIFICSPNNPTGNEFEVAELEKLLSTFKGIVIIDEAYKDFSPSITWSSRLNEFPQLVVLQTLSKAFGLAGIRLGIAICSPEIVAILNKIKPPYNVSQLTQETALEAISKVADVKTQINSILTERKKLEIDLKSLKSVKFIFPSDANFLLVKFENFQAVYEYLLGEGIVVRNRSNEHNCQGCLRISVGTAAENLQLITKLKMYEKSLVY